MTENPFTEKPQCTENSSAHSPEESQQSGMSPAVNTSTSVQGDHKLNWEDILDRGHEIKVGLKHSVPEVDLDFFKNNILPPLQDRFEVGEVVASLERKGSITKGRWECFPEDPICGAGAHLQDPKSFAPVEELFNSIIKVANENPHGLEQTLVLRMDSSNITPDSEGNLPSGPRGYMILKEAEDRVATGSQRHRHDIALTLETGEDDHYENRNDNVKKQLCSLQHAMNSDPCRRFVFGITVENTSMRLWFSSRTVIMVTEAFNFVEDHATLTHIFLSLAFATKAELGWDPTVTVSTKGRVHTYHIEVDGEVYDTVGVLAEFGPDMLGRGTRVFKVTKEGSKNELVLKDVWLNDDQVLEHDIYNDLFSDIEAQLGKSERDAAAKHFITPISSNKVKVNGQEDHTCKIHMRNAVPSFREPFELFIDRSYTIPWGTQGCSCTSSEENHRKHIHHMIHYRILYKEVAESMYKVRTPRGVFASLKGCTKALEYMHRCGWTHRDISCGNVYLYEGRGLLGDLEFAKRMSTDGKYEARVGTYDFMAVEASSLRYRHLPVMREPLDLEAYSAKLSEIVARAKRHDEDASDSNAKQDAIIRPEFNYNGLHDMESLWWILVRVAFFYDDKSRPETNNSKRTERTSRIRGLFPGGRFEMYRDLFLKDDTSYLEALSSLPRDKSAVIVINIIHALRKVLRYMYYKAEATYPKMIDRQAYNGVYAHYNKLWDKFIEDTRTEGIVLVSYYPDSPLKRKASDEPTTDGLPQAPAEKVQRLGSS